MAAVVGKVHQTGLRRGAKLVQKRPGCELCHAFLVHPGKFRPDQMLGGTLQLRHTVQPSGGAAASLSAADQAAALAFPVQLSAFCIQHVHVEEPPQRRALLDRDAERLQFPRLCLDHIKGLTAGVRPQLRPMQQLPGLRCKPFLELPEAVVKGPLDQQTALDRPGDVHRKTDQRLPKLCQQPCLFLRPGLPRVQNLL